MIIDEGKGLSFFEYKILKFNKINGEFELLKDAVAIEEIVNLYINNHLYASFHCTPLKIKELVIGHLLTEGIIEELKDILEIKISGKNIYIKLPESKAFNPAENDMLITSLCSSDRISRPRLLKAPQKLRFNKIKFNTKIIFRAAEILNSMSSLFRISGATHSAIFIDEKGEIVAFAEDIGRHNAVDKVVGETAINGINFNRLLLASTGRLTSEIVIKAVQIGIPILISLSAPTNIGIRIAETFGLTLIGFVRGVRFNIYASPHRIEEYAQH